jgi:cytochrome c oxidase subunit II
MPASSAAQTVTRSRRYHARAVRTASISTKKFALLATLAAAVSALVEPSFAGAIAVEPKSGGSPNADGIVDLYRIVAFFGIIIFLLVEGALIYSLATFRKSKGAIASNAPSNERSDLYWAAAATGFVVLLVAATFIKLPDITDPPNGLASASAAVSSRLASTVDVPTPVNGKKLTINVTGRQFIWRYTYGDNLDSPFSYSEMVVPSETVVVLRIQATDVIHSWWIPALGGKADAVPGSTNYTWFKAPAPKNPDGDVYTGACAEFCGSQHAAMTAKVRVVTPARFATWLAEQKQRISEANRNDVANRNALSSQGQIPDLTPPSK